MPTLDIRSPHDGVTVNAGQPLSVTGQATDRGGAEPVMIDSVTVQVDAGPVVDAALTHVHDPHNTVESYTASVQVTGAEGAHTITVVATNDAGISRQAGVTVFLGPSFQIDAPSIRLEIESPFAVDPSDPKVQALLGALQQDLVPISTLLASADKLIAGPNLVLAQDASGLTVLRIGLWIENLGFTVEPPAPPEFPLPRLSDTAAAAGFGLAPLLPRPHRSGLMDFPFAVSIARSAMQDLAGAALASSQDDDKPDSISVSVSPPSTVTTTADGSAYEVPYTITVTETLGTAPIPGADPPASAPTVVSSSHSSVGDLTDWLIGTLTVVLDIGLLYIWYRVSEAKTGGAAAPLVADLPTRIPFHNTALPGGDAGGVPDFPVLVADWKTLGTDQDGIVGGADATIQSRDQSMVGLAIRGPDFLHVPPGEYIASSVYTIVLTDLAPDPGALTWELWSSIDNHTETGTIDLGGFAQTASLAVDFPMPLHLSPGTYQYRLGVAATETCGTDPAKILTAAASKDIKVQKPKPHTTNLPGPQPTPEAF
jgi:hypothetical protein